MTQNHLRTWTSNGRLTWPHFSSRHLIGIIMLCAAGVYLAKLPTFQVGFYHDDALYITLARSISTGQGFRRIELAGAPLTTFEPFGYPLLLSPLVRIFPDTFLPLQVLSVLLSLGSISLLWVFVKKRVLKPLAMLVVLLFAFQPNIVAHASMVMTEAPFIFFTLLALVLLDRYEADRRVFTWTGLGLALATAMAYFVRIPGLVLFAAIVGYLLLRRQWRKAALIGLIVGLGLAAWSCRNWLVAGVLFSKEHEQASFFSDTSRYLLHVQSSVEDYAVVLPRSILPLIGPKAVALLSGVLPWIPSVVNFMVFSVTALGFVAAWRLEMGAANLYVIGLSAVLLVFRSFGDGRMLLPLIPFLYLYFALGIWFLARLLLSAMRLALPPTYIAACCLAGVLLLNVARDAQSILDPLRRRVPDVALGATWLNEHAPPDAIIMARIPRSTFIYADRASVPYPDGAWDSKQFYGTLKEATPQAAFLQTIDTYGVDFLLVAPPITVNGDSSGPVLDAYMRETILPVVRGSPDRFRLVYDNPSQQVFVYEVGH